MFIAAAAASPLVLCWGGSDAATLGLARSYIVTGTSGYLSEWELNGRLSATPDGSGQVLTGPLAMKHRGLCSANGPEEKAAQMRLKIIASRAPSRVDGEIVMNGATCTFSGSVSGAFAGSMNCPDAKGVPFTFSMQ
jgi:hypothetical protein